MAFTGEVKSDFMKEVLIPLDKRPSVIDYAATDFLSIRNSVIDYVKAVYPLDYENFSESDLGIMLVEVIAYMGSVFSLKADMLANENYIQTAKLRRNVKKLLSLVGVRMKGPIAAAANAKITWPWSEDGDPWNDGDSTMSIAPEGRVLTINSPEDGAQLTYTLYKVHPNGQVDLNNTNGNITLTGAEASGAASGVHSNCALLEGAYIVQDGSFKTTELVKTISLTESPVIEGSVNVLVEGDYSTSGNYKQVENLYTGSGATDRIFQLTTDDDFRATIVFGGNDVGQAPSMGDTFKVTYRVGGGSRGNIKKEVINTTLVGTTIPGGVTYTANLTNTSVGTGGANAETLEHAKRYAPLTFRRQDRLVTLPDFESFASTYTSTYGSVGKATAVTRQAYSSANIIDIYVLEKASDSQLRRATPTFKSDLLSSMNDKKMLTDELVIVDGLIRTLDLVITIRIEEEVKRQEPEILALVRNNVMNYFFVDNREFGESFILQDLVRNIHEIEKVRFATIDNLSGDVHIEHNEIIQLNNLTINVVTL
jgi:hypothetical protein